MAHRENDNCGPYFWPCIVVVVVDDNNDIVVVVVNDDDIVVIFSYIFCCFFVVYSIAILGIVFIIVIPVMVILFETYSNSLVSVFWFLLVLFSLFL